MRRGEIYRVRPPPGRDPRRQRLFVVVSRQVLIDSAYSTVICAPIYESDLELATQVSLRAEDGVQQPCAVHCDGLVSIEKARLTDFVAALSSARLRALDAALLRALEFSAPPLRSE